MSTEVTRRRPPRAFLTQSAHSSAGTSSRRPATATATIGAFEEDQSIFNDTEPTERICRPVSANNSTMIRLAATVDDAKSRMSSMRRTQQIEADQLNKLMKRSNELKNYSRERFLDRMKMADAQPASQPDQATVCLTKTSKCVLSPYVTTRKPVDVGDSYCCESASTPEELQNGRSRTRAQLMSQLRLYQPIQSVRFRHDRTAQELVQEGCLPSRSLCEAFPWQQGYKYTPYPTPKLLDWTKDEAERRLERQRLAEDFDRVATPPTAATPPTPPTSPPALTMTPAEPPAAQDAEPMALLALPSPLATEQLQQQQQQQQRPKSGRAKPLRRSHPKHHHREQHQLTPEQQALLLEQQLAEKAAARRRNFSVSTIGEDELATTHLEQQRLADVCQRLRDRQLAREAAAAAAAAEAAAAEAALRAAIEAANAPVEPPTPPKTPPTEKTASKNKKRGGSASSGRKQQKTGAKSGKQVEKKQTTPKSPRSASSRSDKANGTGGVAKAKKRQSGATSNRSSSISGDSAKPLPPEDGKQKNATDQPKQNRKAAPRAKSPKGGKKAPAGKKTSKASQKPDPTPPPIQQQPALETQPTETQGPDPIDLLADEIEAAQVFHQTKPAGALPDFPCPSSEEKSRQQLTKIWWQRQAIASVGVSLIT